MGIVKIRHFGPDAIISEKFSSKRPKLGDLAQEPQCLLEEDLDGDRDDSEPVDAGFELATVGGRICGFPYELYELPNLKEILSLNSWNSLLTDEEQFSLSAFLPDMDQETYFLTMRELLGGGNLFFGSPLDEFFRRMKGGFYSQEATQFRECRHNLQRRTSYFSLRNYHEDMRRKFIEMERSWTDCLPNATIEERVRNWNNTRKAITPVLLVDLNAIPAEEEMQIKRKKTPSSSRGAISEFLIGSGEESVKKKAKGVLKIKAAAAAPRPQNHLVQSFQGDTVGKKRSLPKGVLKIIPRGNFFCQSGSNGSIIEPSQKMMRTNNGTKFRGEVIIEERSLFTRRNRNPSSFDGESRNIERNPSSFLSEIRVSAPSEGSSKHSMISDLLPDSELEQAGQILPITYRRKKEFTKPKKAGSAKKVRNGTNSEHLVESEEMGGHMFGKMKPIKIKIKGWNNNRNAP